MLLLQRTGAQHPPSTASHLYFQQPPSSLPPSSAHTCTYHSPLHKHAHTTTVKTFLREGEQGLGDHWQELSGRALAFQAHSLEFGFQLEQGVGDDKYIFKRLVYHTIVQIVRKHEKLFLV